MRRIETAYHLLDARNWASVRRYGLLSTQRLMGLSGNADEAALRRHRETGQQLACGAHIRDQRPMPPRALSRCLKNGLQPEDWYALLNSKVFFWLDPERLNRQRRACDAIPHYGLVIDAQRLLVVHGDAATVTPINTGNAMRTAAPRNLTTFVPYASWVADGWTHGHINGASHRPANHRPVELAIADAVPDILDFVLRVVPLGPGEILTAAVLSHR